MPPPATFHTEVIDFTPAAHLIQFRCFRRFENRDSDLCYYITLDFSEMNRSAGLIVTDLISENDEVPFTTSLRPYLHPAEFEKLGNYIIRQWDLRFRTFKEAEDHIPPANEGYLSDDPDHIHDEQSERNL